MLLDGQVRASVMPAIACRNVASVIVLEFLTLMTRAVAFVLLGTQAVTP